MGSPKAGREALTRGRVLELAELARLELSSAEADALTQDLDAILGYVAKLDALDAELAEKHVEPTSHAVPMTNAFREDVAQPGLDLQGALGNAPQREGRNIVVPRVIEE